MESRPKQQTPAHAPSRTSRGHAAGLSGTAWSLAALAAGLGLGLLLHGSNGLMVSRLTSFIEPIGQVWMAALALMVFPLVITQALAAMSRRSDESIGALGGKTLLLFVLMLVAAGLFTLVIAPPLVSLFPADAQMASVLARTARIPLSGSAAPARSIASRLAVFLPKDIFRVLRGEQILPALLLAMLVGFCVARLPGRRREPLQGIFQSLARATMMVIGWILTIAPLGVFALGFVLSARVGMRIATFLGSYLAIVCTALIVSTAMLYPVTCALARVSMRRFSRAAAKAQAVAVSTRSSLVSLPALVEGGREYLDLPAPATSFVLPLAVSVFKIDRTISCVAEVLFLSKVFHVHLGLPELATFLATILLLSFSTAGIPDNGGASDTLAAYLAAGIPIQGPVILRSVVAIPDIFQTLINVTGDMSAAAILSRSRRRQPAA